MTRGTRVELLALSLSRARAGLGGVVEHADLPRDARQAYPALHLHRPPARLPALESQKGPRKSHALELNLALGSILQSTFVPGELRKSSDRANS